MQQLATITSKRQLTIPASMFRRLDFKKGQKVLVSEENGTLKVEPAMNLVERLAGSVNAPKRYQGQSLEKIIKQAKKEYFSKR